MIQKKELLNYNLEIQKKNKTDLVQTDFFNNNHILFINRDTQYIDNKSNDFQLNVYNSKHGELIKKK